MPQAIKKFQPMLASPVDFSKVVYPVLVSPKLDGIRCLVRGAVALTRSLKPIPNTYIQSILGHEELNGFDGEIIVGDPTDKNCYQATSSGVMSHDGEPQFMFYVFDFITSDLNVPYHERRYQLSESCLKLDAATRKFIAVVMDTIAGSLNRVEAIETNLLSNGYEGVMIRRGDAPYKMGRSTAKENYLTKLKRFSDGEATILGAECLMSNQNEAGTDALGHTERSTNAAGLVPQDTLGNLLVKDLASGVEFSIGSGFTADQRNALWKARDTLPGQIVKYKFFAIGVVDKPRFPTYLGFRDTSDM